MDEETNMSEMGAEKFTYEVVEAYDENEVGDKLDLTEAEAAPHMAQLKKVVDADDEEEDDDDEDGDDDEKEEKDDEETV